MAQKTILIIGAGEYIASETNTSISRETILLAASNVDLPAGTVLGRARGTQTVAAPVARTGNAGNGAISAVTIDPTKVGRGNVGITFTDATHFVVEAPGGQEVGSGVAGTPFNKGGVQLTFTAGGTPMAANDGFDIAVSYAADGTYAPLNPSATDGTQNFAGHLFEGRYASVSSQKAVATVRSLEVNGNKVTYLNAVNATQLAAVEAQAAAQGVITRY